MNLKEKESVYTSSRDGNLQYLKVSFNEKKSTYKKGKF